jgi:hypothetical protein
MELTVRTSHCQFREPNRSTVRRHDTSSAIASGSAVRRPASRRITSRRTNPVAAFHAAPAFDNRPGTFVLLPLGATVRLRIALSATSGRIVRPASVARGCTRGSRVREDVRRRPGTCPQRSIHCTAAKPNGWEYSAKLPYLQVFTRGHLERVAGGTGRVERAYCHPGGNARLPWGSGGDRNSVEPPVTRSPVRRAGAAARRSGCRADSREDPA